MSLPSNVCMQEGWAFTKQKETIMNQAAIIPPVDAHKKQDAIDFINSLNAKDKKDAAQQLGFSLHDLSKQVNDWICLPIFVTFATLLVRPFLPLPLALSL